MPKAAAIQPLEWATIHPGMGTFDIDELNLLQCLKVIGLIAVVSIGVVSYADFKGFDDAPLDPAWSPPAKS